MDTDEPAATKTPASPAKSPNAGQRRTKCKYWNKCYRKDKGHKALYIHPGDPDEKQAAPVNVKGMHNAEDFTYLYISHKCHLLIGLAMSQANAIFSVWCL